MATEALVHSEQVVSFAKKSRFRGVQILRLAFDERSSAKGDDLSRALEIGNMMRLAKKAAPGAAHFQGTIPSFRETPPSSFFGGEI